MLVCGTAEAAGVRELFGGLRLLALTLLSKQGVSMGDLRETGARRQTQGQPWLKRQEELVGVLLWAVGITTLALLPDTGLFIPVHPPVFVGLKVVAALLWLLVGAQCLQRLAQRYPQEP
jgi:hypothetical protein